MLAAEYILIDISLISCSPSCTNITELWNIPSAFYLWSATVPGWSNTEYQHSRKPWTLGAIKIMHLRFKMAIKRIFTKSWRICYLLYLAVFFFSLSCVIITADEYEGGNKLAEFGTSIFVIFTFPIFFLYDLFNGTYSSEYDFLLLILFLLNFLTNSFLIVTLLNFLFLKLKGVGDRPPHKV
jgi:hypothetical protein